MSGLRWCSVERARNCAQGGRPGPPRSSAEPPQGDERQHLDAVADVRVLHIFLEVSRQLVQFFSFPGALSGSGQAGGTSRSQAIKGVNGVGDQ